MRSCEELHPLILDYLYGLLEPDEEQQVRAHVAGCPKCQAAELQARREQSLFARAAQTGCVVAPFVAPSDSVVPGASTPVDQRTPAPDSPAVLQLPLRQRRPAWQRWAMAAAAASIVVTGVALYYQHEEKLDEYRQTSRRAVREVEVLDGKIAKVQQDFDKASAEVPAEIAQSFIHVNVVGPFDYYRDAPAGFRVTTRDVRGEPVAVTCTATLVHGDERRVLGKFKSNGETQIQVPAELAGPARVSLEVQADKMEKPLDARLNAEAPQHVTHVALNKGSYRIGDVLFLRTLTLQRYSLKPPAEPIPLTYTLRDSTGKVRMQKEGVTGPGGIGGGEFALGNDIQDGDYFLDVAENGSRFRVAPQRRRIEIQRGLNPELHFDRAHYKPGDSGVAIYRGRRTEGGKAIAEQPLFGNITVNGKPLPGAAKGGGAGPVTLKTDKNGEAKFPFHLPDNMDLGKAVIVVEEADKKAKVEQAIPVVVSKRMVDFFPEGGELVAGVPTRVYYRVRTPAGEPVPPEGHVILISMNTGDVLLDSRWGQGVGAFPLTPDANDTYNLRITWPKKNAQDENEKNWDETTQPFAALPPIRSSGLVLSVPSGVSREGEALPVVLQNRGAARSVLVLATCRGRVVDQQLVEVPASVQVAKNDNILPGKTEVKLQPVTGAAGMVRVTAFELLDGPDLKPMAERLVYRLPAQSLRLSVRSNQAEHHGGDKAYFQVKATTESGRSDFAYGLGIAVEQKAAPRQAGLPAHFYLLSEVEHGQDLDNADFVITDTPEPVVEWFPGAGLVMAVWDNLRRLEKQQALDLFLGTHGWRRFADDKAGNKIEHAVAAKAQQKRVEQLRVADRTMIQSVENMSLKALSRLYQESLQRREEELRLRASGQLARLTADREEVLKTARTATLALADLEHKPRELLRLGVGILTIVLVGIGGILLAFGVLRLARQGSARPALAGAMVVLFFALAVYGLVGTRLEREGGAQGDMLAHLRRPSPTLAAAAPAAPVHMPATGGLFAAKFEKADDTARAELKDGDDRPSRGLSLAEAKKQNSMPDINMGGMTADAMGDDKADSGRSKEYLQFYATVVAEQQKRTAALHKALDKKMAEKNNTDVDGKDPKKKDGFAKAKKGSPGKNDGHHLAMMMSIPTDPPREYFTQEFVAVPVYQDTILWSPSLRFPDEVSFVLPPQAATYRIFLYANSPTGRLGYYQGTLSVK